MGNSSIYVVQVTYQTIKSLQNILLWNQLKVNDPHARTQKVLSEGSNPGNVFFVCLVDEGRENLNTTKTGPHGVLLAD